jgi:hypothetical protein
VREPREFLVPSKLIISEACAFSSALLGTAASFSMQSLPCGIDPGEIFDDVQNIAARPQALTDPGSLVVTARVRHQFAPSVVEERGSHELEGVPEPVTLLHLGQEEPQRSRGGEKRRGEPVLCFFDDSLENIEGARARGAR